MNKLKVVKIIVAVLTFLLIFGMLMVLTILFKKFDKPQKAVEANKKILLQQPFGSVIEQIIVNDGLIYVLVKDGGVSDRILVLSSDNYQIINEIILN